MDKLSLDSDRPTELLDAVEAGLDGLKIGGVAKAHGFVVTEGDARNDGNLHAFAADVAFVAHVGDALLRASECGDLRDFAQVKLRTRRRLRHALTAMEASLTGLA